MTAKIHLGKGLKKEVNVILGLRGKTSGELKIGQNCFLRSGAVVYQNVVIGNDCFVGHNAVIREDNELGNGVVVGVNCYLGPKNKIGDKVILHTGCFLEMAVIEDEVAFGPQVLLIDDPHPRCPRFEECVGGVTIKKKAKIGAGVVILPGITIGERALVGAGSVVTKDVAPGVVVVGNPAKMLCKKEDLVCKKGFFKKVYEWEDQ